MDKTTTPEEGTDIPRPNWSHKIFSAVEEKVKDPYLSVCHYNIPIMYRSDRKQFILIDDDDFTKTLSEVQKNKDFFMTCFVRRGNNNETVVGLQQKFKGTVPDKTIVSFNSDYHYRWTNSKNKIVTITHHIGSLTSEALYGGALKLVKECESFLITYTEEGEELLESLSKRGKGTWGTNF